MTFSILVDKIKLVSNISNFDKSYFWTIFIPEFDLDLDKVKQIVSNSNSLKVIGEEMKN